MRTQGSIQKQINNIDTSLQQSFKATSNLANALKKEKAPKEDSRGRTLFMNTGKELLKQAKIEKQNEQYFKKVDQIPIESEVVALPYLKKPVSNPKTEDMLKRQRESRRDRHIKTNDDFEMWIKKLYRDIENQYEQIKKEVKVYFNDSNEELRSYLSKQTDKELLKREKDLLEEMDTLINNQERLRGERVNGLDKRLDDLEDERENNLRFLCETLRSQLIEIAHILEPEADQMRDQKMGYYREQVRENKQKNEIFVAEINDFQLKSFEEFRGKKLEIEGRWKKLRHEEALENFGKQIKTMEYVNPEKRVKLYQNLKKQHSEIFSKRKNFVERLRDCDYQHLSRSVVEKWTEDIKNFNESAQEVFNKFFSDLVSESEETDNKIKNRIQELKERLAYVSYLDENELETLIENQCNSQATKLNFECRELMSQAIKYVEETDFKQNEICLNISKFYLKFANSNDEYKMALKKMNLDYQIAQAQSADNHDEKKEELEEQFSAIKEKLKRSLHHPRLEEILQEAFTKIDQMESEYRIYHENNRQIAKDHPNKINDLYKNTELGFAKFFDLYGNEKRAELEQRNKEAAEEKVKKLIAKEEKEKLLEEERQANEAAGKKGAKKPAPKKVDPKKAQQEYEQKFKEYLEKQGVEPVEMYTSPTGEQFIVGSSISEQAEKFYNFESEEEKQKREEEDIKNRSRKGSGLSNKSGGKKDQQLGSKEQLDEDDDEKKKIPIDFIENPPKDPEGRIILEPEIIFKKVFIQDMLEVARDKIFHYVNEKKDLTLKEALVQDKEFIENSVLYLDEKLKENYPLKGKVEVEIYQLRSQQITQHKKRYERHARQAIEKADIQTENFNILLEGGLEITKIFESDIKNYRESLPEGKTLASLQGIQNSVKDKCAKYEEKQLQLKEKLLLLANEELDMLLTKNSHFIKESKLIEEEGTYSQDEIEWYQNMLNEINDQFKSQKDLRTQRTNEIIKHMENKRQDLLVQFEKEYEITIEELAAKDGTGRKYGRPRRLAQERTKSEQNKCDRSQEAINHFIDEIESLYQEYNEKKSDPYEFAKMEPSFSLRIRKILMSIRTCMLRYAIHIDAIKNGAAIQELKRVSYIENRFNIYLESSEVDADNQLKQKELENLGPLFFQKENKNFSDWIIEIEKQVIVEAQKLYVAEKAKFLTGADKIPDYLRNYFSAMKEKMAEFKINCIRSLRKSCVDLSEKSSKISEMVFGSIKLRYNGQINYELTELGSLFESFKNQCFLQKQKNEKNLRPGLSNPACQEELVNLNKNERERVQQFVLEVDKFQTQSLDKEFFLSNEFFKTLLNNFEFLISYYDTEYLYEDFVQLPGDDMVQKKHENIKTLLRLKQNGTVIDTSSERCYQKTWSGLEIQSFKLGNREIQYDANGQGQEDEQQGKGGKKDTKKQAKKDSKKEDDEVVNTTHTKEIKSIKTYRQKSAFQFREAVYQEFLERFKKNTQEIQKFYDDLKYKEQKFQFKWIQTVHGFQNLPQTEVEIDKSI